MATTKKTETKKKASTKKTTTKKNKVAKPVKEEVLEVVNGDPAVLAPIEEAAPIEELKKEEIVPIEEPEPQKEKVEAVTEVKVEKKETAVKKITKKVNQYFGYFWNGQMIDF